MKQCLRLQPHVALPSLHLESKSECPPFLRSRVSHVMSETHVEREWRARRGRAPRAEAELLARMTDADNERLRRRALPLHHTCNALLLHHTCNAIASTSRLVMLQAWPSSRQSWDPEAKMRLKVQRLYTAATSNVCVQKLHAACWQVLLRPNTPAIKSGAATTGGGSARANVSADSLCF